MENQDKPTKKFYGLFQYIFDHYNDHLYDGKIKDCIIVVTRKHNVFGHYAHKRWFHVDDKETDELALNPEMFLKFPLLEICQTMVHEMCHAWQHHYGKPSRPGYHNKEWANKMIEIGLMPSDTGKEGGKITGFAMADYAIKEGKFLQVSEELMNNEVFAGLYFEVNPMVFEQVNEDEPLFAQIIQLANAGLVKPKPKPRKSKVKYSCSCANVWGKPGLELFCKTCGEDMIEQ